ncbi:MAG: type II toxin-antitoxin system Phd/YefM family antitoxin [bacterium]|jgi:prevent-host-death family protein
MKTMVISDFKAKCIAVLKNAQHDEEPVLITWHGHPLAKVVPICDQAAPRKLGSLKGLMRIKTDIVHAGSSQDWEMNR